MYAINAIGIRFNIGYKKIDDDNYDCSLSVTAFNNSISKQSSYEVIYSKEEEFSFVRENINKVAGSMLASLYDKCISGIKSLDEMRSEYNKYFYRQCIRDICKGMFSNKILKYTDSGNLEFTILTPIDDIDCSIYGTIPNNLKCELNNDNHLINTFTVKHPDISGYEFLKYSVSRDITNLTDEEKKDFIRYYPYEYMKIYKDTIVANVICMINGFNQRVKTYTDIKALRNFIRTALS